MPNRGGGLPRKADKGKARKEMYLLRCRARRQSGILSDPVRNAYAVPNLAPGEGN
jgi:hypothetical protein